jgi:hypothetical protein
MGLLRDDPAPVPLAVVERLTDAGDRPRLHRCLEGLVADGLVELVGNGDELAYRLPA